MRLGATAVHCYIIQIFDGRWEAKKEMKYLCAGFRLGSTGVAKRCGGVGGVEMREGVIAVVNALLALVPYH